MSARIAPDPISTTIGTATDYRSRTMSGDLSQRPAPFQQQPQQQRNADTGSRFAEHLPPIPSPPAPPGTAFAAAIVAGALSPRPQSPQEVFLRIGMSWTPPESELHLTDRIA